MLSHLVPTSSQADPLVWCPACGLRGHADRNASLKIGQRCVARCLPKQKEKPPALRVRSQGEPRKGRVLDLPKQPKTEAVGHSSLSERHGSPNGHGTAQENHAGMAASLRSIPSQLRHFEE